MSKILERIIANRLSLLARLVGLIHPNQCGSLPGLSTFDACASLSHEVRALQRANCKASTLFLDIKGGFDNVSSSHLSSILRQKGVSAYLVAWIRSFLTNRQCRLVFQGAPNIFSPVSVGTPQGSPISPLLFVIYVSSLHLSIPKGIMFSYVDDFTVTVGSLSYRRNTQRLQHYYSTLKRRANSLGVSFSIPKTELCHWRTTRDRAPISPAPVCLDGSLFHPSSLVRWLGYWFTPSMDTTPHFTKRLALAQGAFATIKQLSSPGSGLPPYLNRRLAMGLLLPILTYGCDLFSPNVTMQDKMTVFWNKVMRWITNCFSSTPVPILACEACLPPLFSLLPHRRRMATLRLACAPPEINPAASRLPPSFPSSSSHRAQDSNRYLTVGLKGNYIPLRWNQARPKPAVRSHLPIDGIVNLLTPLSSGTSFFPMVNLHLLPDLPPTVAPGTKSYSSLKRESRTLLMDHWTLQAPPPLYYLYKPTTVPHAFMGLDRFSAGRIHQMRAGKSYLAAHLSWSDDRDPLCPSCEEEDETFHHAVLSCKSKSEARRLHLSGVGSIAHDSPLWADKKSLIGLAAYIRATHTNFPPGMLGPA